MYPLSSLTLVPSLVTQILWQWSLSRNKSRVSVFFVWITKLIRTIKIKAYILSCNFLLISNWFTQITSFKSLHIFTYYTLLQTKIRITCPLDVLHNRSECSKLTKKSCGNQFVAIHCRLVKICSILIGLNYTEPCK